MADERVDSSNLVDIVYRAGLPELTDAAENYFEASKLYSSGMPWDVPGAALLERSPEMRTMTTRSARRYHSRPTVALPERAPLSGDLATLLANRRSTDGFSGGSIGLPVLASLLLRTYGISGRFGAHTLRPTPSGGALYPLDVFVVARRIDGLRDGGLYHFDPFRALLADLGDIDLPALDNCLNPPELAAESATTIVLTASFWRSRFKYGQRALRFVLMESGHLAQNLLLVAAGHGLAARPLGGFLDGDLTALLPDHNGVDDAPVYSLLIGTPREE